MSDATTDQRTEDIAAVKRLLAECVTDTERPGARHAMVPLDGLAALCRLVLAQELDGREIGEQLVRLLAHVTALEIRG